MGLRQEAFPVDTEATVMHWQAPEFSPDPPEDVLIVGEGKIVIGSVRSRFRSIGFDGCSGIALKDPFARIFGFFHIYPARD